MPDELAIQRLTADLARPLWDEAIRDPDRHAGAGELDVAGGLTLVGGGDLGPSLTDFRRFCRIAMSLPATRGTPVVLECVDAASRVEDHTVVVAEDAIRVTGAGPNALRRGLVWLIDEMRRRRAPILPLGAHERRCQVAVRISRSPVARYRFAGGWELEQDHEAYPDAYLDRLVHLGVNAIWVAGFFRHLIATRALPEWGPPRTRLERLARLVERAASRGIAVYFFCIEPRITLDTAIFARYPDIRGTTYPPDCSLGESAFCSSSPRVQAYIREATAELFRQAPGLGGMIHIFCGERGAHCWYSQRIVQGCPRCSRRPQEEVLAEFLNCFRDGMREVSPAAELLAGDYTPNAAKMHLIGRLAEGVVWLSCFEHGGRKTLLGQEREIDEYSLSYPGPAPIFRDLVRRTGAVGQPLYAKLQLGTTYELSSVPHIPVPTSVYRKFRYLHAADIRGAMLSWIIGGFPSLMLKATGEAAFAPLADETVFLERLAGLDWGEAQAPVVVRAWRHFWAAFRQFPMNNEVFYYGPLTRSPAYLLELDPEPGIADPYNFGVDCQGRAQPFEDDPARWCGTFTPEQVRDSFRRIATRWQRGVHLLDRLTVAGDAVRQRATAAAVAIQFAAAANVVDFYRLRPRLATDPTVRDRLVVIAEAEIVLAQRMLALLPLDPALGFHSELLVRSYAADSLARKIVHTRETIARLSER